MEASSSQTDTPNGIFQDRFGWYVGVSSYWFATSFKWFLIIGTLISGQLSKIVPGGDKNGAWGMVFTVGACWALLGPSLFGSISDRFHSRHGRRKPFLVYGALATIGALALLANASQFWMFIVGYLALQVADDLGTGPYAALIPEIIPSERRGRASGVLGLLRMLSNILGGLTAFLLHSVGYTYFLMGALQVLCVAWVLYLLRNYDDSKATEDSVKPPALTFKGFVQGWIEPWSRHDFRLVWLLTFLVTLGFYMVQPYMKNYLQDVVQVYQFFGMSISNADPEKAAASAYGILGLTIALFGAVGAVWSSRVSDRIGHKAVMKIAGPIMFLPLIPFALFPNFQLMILLGTLFGFGYGVFLSASWAIASDVMPEGGQEGKDMGLWQASWASPQIIAGLSGTMIDLLNKKVHKGWGYSTAIIIAAVFFAIGSTLVQKVRGSR